MAPTTAAILAAGVGALALAPAGASTVVTLALTHPEAGVKALERELNIISDPKSKHYGEWCV